VGWVFAAKRPSRSGILETVHVTVVANPAKDPGGSAVEAVQQACRERCWPEPDVRSTTVVEPGAPQAAEAVAAGADLVVVVGGDGTVREAANGVAGTGVPLGIVPLGTANLFARNLRLPLGNVTKAVTAALDSEARDVDLGVARWGRPDGHVGEGAFVMLAGIGHDARTIELVRPALKRHLQWVAYFVPALETLGAPLLPLTIRRDGGPPTDHDLWCLLIGNVGRIPLGIDVLPGARVDDGLLHVAAVGPSHILGWVPIALKGLLRWRRDVPGLAYATATSVRVETQTPLTIHVDGDEHGGVTWLEASIDKAALRVRAPLDPPETH